VVVIAQIMVFWLVAPCNTVGGHEQDYEPPSSGPIKLGEKAVRY
jgi:hypothetical protein